MVRALAPRDGPRGTTVTSLVVETVTPGGTLCAVAGALWCGTPAQPASASASATGSAAPIRLRMGLVLPWRLDRDGRPVRLQRQRRPDQRAADPARQRQPELGAAVLFAPRLQPAAVQPRVLQADRQAQPGAAGG